MGKDEELAVPPTMRSIVSAMRAEKNRAVRKDAFAYHHIDVYRSGKRILRVAVPEPTDCLDLLCRAPSAMCADYIIVAADSWTADRLDNPINGKEWKLGDMQRIVSEDMGLERGLIREGIMAIGVERGGAVTSVILRYTNDRAKRKIIWDRMEPYETGDGRFPHYATEGFAQPTIVEQALAEVGPPPEGYDMEDLIRKASVTYVLALPDHYRVIEGPKGQPLAGHMEWRRPKENKSRMEIVMPDLRHDSPRWN